MSTSSARRIKDSGGGGGGGGKVTAAKPSKTLTPVFGKGGETLKKSTGKENPRPISTGRASVAAMSQKPVIRSIPRIEKPSASSAGERDSGFRSSSSSVPRGRSSSPSEFNRGFSDFRNGRVSRVSSGVEFQLSVSNGRK